MKKDTRALQSYIVADKLFYETMDRYAYSECDFLGRISGRLGPEWRVKRKGVWLNCVPDGSELPLQGWKIHLSARRKDAAEILELAAGVLVPRKVPFKFLLDRNVLTLTNSKSWGRGGAGKFITVYPDGETQFRGLLEALGEATSAFSGPYILSDRRYKDYKVVYYRYGGIRLNTLLEPDGQRTPVLVAPSGEKVPDARTPYFSLPAWVQDISAPEKSAGGGLNGGRYKVTSSLGFSNSGGVYLGLDGVSGEKVVIKEARPWVNEAAPDQDMVSLLRKEHRILESLKDLGIAPRPVELFSEWEHTFLVQEYLATHQPLGKWSATNDIALRTRFTRSETRAFFLKYLDIFGNLAEVLRKLHGRGVVFGDFSSNNIMVHPDSLEVKLIDFEGARESGAPSPAWFFTPGFSDPSRPAGKELSFEDDYYAFGANMLYTLMRVGQMSPLIPDAADRWLASLVEEYGFPEELRRTIAGFLAPDASARPLPWEAMGPLAEAVRAMPEGGEPVRLRLPRRPAGYYGELAAAAARQLLAQADIGRKDRLWPSQPDVFETNPLCVAWGAAGVLKALHKTAPSETPRELLDWTLRTEVRPEDYPPGLYSGISGIAWTLLDLGLEREARELFAKADGHPLTYASHDLFNGAAGWGLTNLRFWRATGESDYLARARACGERLLAMAERDGGRLHWKTSSKNVPLGLGFGASGTALFLAYLARACSDTSFAEGAAMALDFDLSHRSVSQDGGWSWPPSTAPGAALLPYLDSGGAGIGMVCLRLWKLYGDKKYLESVEKIYVDCDRNYTVFPGRDNGLAGLGEFLLDAHGFTGEARYREAALKVASGLEKFAAAGEKGPMFPGNGLLRLSCDYATGAAGICSFLARLESGGGTDYMPDDILEAAQ
jgi:tRNA A-37 threonylcarbamoyl transferase component Bud32